MARKSKAKKSKTSKPGLQNVEPTYLKRGTSYKMGLHDVIRAIKAIEERQNLDKFVRAAKKQGASVSVDAKTVNFVKDFMVKSEMHDHPVAAHIVNAKTADPFKPCKFGRNG